MDEYRCWGCGRYAPDGVCAGPHNPEEYTGDIYRDNITTPERDAYRAWARRAQLEVAA